MSMRVDDDDELSFAEDVSADASTERRDDVAEPVAAPVTDPPPEAPAAETAAPQKPEVKTANEGEQATVPAAPKRSRTGMAVAAGFAICIIASITSAVQAWRAASMVAHGGTGKSDTALEAKLNNIEKLLEQQRNALDGIATPVAVATPMNGGDQINALAAAVRANQEMTERLPAMIMRNVDARLAGAKHAKAGVSAARPTVKKVAAKKPAAITKAQKKPVIATTTAAAALPLKTVQPISAEPPRRPAGEAIRYP